ncbi:Uncharacterised protein [Salmonella enterica subsp. enterica]|uniref:Uncharacterized protein n=1 Tax=Salmonella enterica I TaxID=59201 RepID=A0A379WYA5_SALET|nr:Uncharacterised protein [Salmonella enterica subsp. enterica]
MSEVTQTPDRRRTGSLAKRKPHHRPRFTQRFLALLYVARIVEL